MPDIGNGARMETSTIKLPSEPALDGVLEEDRISVRNVIYVLHALRLCVSWSVTAKKDGYEIVGSIDAKVGSVTENRLRDMEVIRKVDALRITTVATRILAGPSATVSLVVFILRKSEPVVLEEQEVVHIQRKRRFWSSGSG